MAEGLRDPGHLPNLRPGRQPAPPERLPRQRAGTAPQGRGRYPDYDVLANASHWDEVTREVVLSRVRDVPDLRFFTVGEARALGAFCDTVLAQDSEPRVPVLAMVDAKLADGKLDGYRYADMPEDPETWRRVALGIDESAGGSFAALGPEERKAVVERFRQGELHGGVWDELSCSRAWSVVMRAILSEFYSHPWTWNEIGYGGPRYPRGYQRLGAGAVEPDMEREALDPDPVTEVGS